MKTHTQYQCEVCGARSKQEKEIRACEAQAWKEGAHRKGEEIEVLIERRAMLDPQLQPYANQWVKGKVSRTDLQLHSHEARGYWVELTDVFVTSRSKKRMKLYVRYSCVRKLT